MRTALLIALSGVTLVQAEQGQTPQRDSSRPTQSSPARIRGRVLAADTGQPLGRAEVAISVPSGMRRTLTDADGRYEFTDVPAGTVQVTASKTGYVTLQQGQRRPFEPGRPVVVVGGQTADRVDFSLPRGAVIAVRIADDLGFPMAGVEVRVQRYQYRSDGQRALTLVSNAIRGPDLTDDRGEVRAFGLMPGEYVVSANSRFLPSIGAASGGEGYAPTFYPGVITANQATPIAVGIGEERTAQFSMVRSRLARISGMVVDTQGRPANGANVMLGSSFVTGPGSAHVGVDGTFAIGNVAPGDYALMVNYDAYEALPQTLTVSGADISDLRLVVGGGTTVSGTIVFEAAGPATGRPAVRATVASATPPPVPGLSSGQKSIGPDDDGRFQITGMTGSVIVGATVPQGWMVKSVVADGREISDEVIDLGGRARLSDVTVTVTNRLTTLSGQVTDARSQPVSEYVVVIVPVGAYHPGVMAQRVKAMRPGPSGTFTTQGMRPGRYVAVAVSALEDGRHFSPEFQQQVRRIGQEFTLGEGQTAALNVRLIPDL